MAPTRTTVFRSSAGLTAAALALGLSACGSASASDGDAPLRIEAASTPHLEILEYIEDELITEDDGLELDLTEQSEGVQTNQVIIDEQIDGSFHQHIPFLTQWLADAGEADDAIVSVATVHVEPLGLYFHQDGEVASLDDVQPGTTVAITNDAVNQSRALFLLADAGLLTLPEGFERGVDPLTVKDVAADEEINTSGLEFTEVEYALTARAVVDQQTDLAVVNGNVALQSDLDIDADTLALESAQDNPYANDLTVIQELADDPRVEALAGYLESPEVSAWITEQFGSAVLPVHPAG